MVHTDSGIPISLRAPWVRHSPGSGGLPQTAEPGFFSSSLVPSPASRTRISPPFGAATDAECRMGTQLHFPSVGCL